MKKVIVIGGATASGKTSLSVSLAQQLNTEVISADSMLIYKGLNIGTAKPSVEEMYGVKHHLIDICTIEQTFSVSEYVDLASPIIDSLHNENKTPIICGGTGLYIKSVLFEQNLADTERDEKLREKYSKILEEKGNLYLHSMLREVDEESASKLHPNDTIRVIRALEIYESTGKTKSSFKQDLVARYDYNMFAIQYEREELYNRINLRVDEMIKNGLIDEVENLISNGLNENCQCMQGIGYREVYDFLKGRYSKEDMIDTLKKNTRHYAKKQITLFKRLPNIVWLNPRDNNVEKILKIHEEIC